MFSSRLEWYANRLTAMSLPEIVHRTMEKASQKLERSRYTGSPVYMDCPGFLSVSYSEKLPEVNDRFYFNYLNHSVVKEYTNAFPGGIDKTIEKAGRILSGRLSIQGLGEFDYGDDINWHSGILTSNSWPKIYSPELDFRQRDDIGDVRLTWEINRHFQLVILAKAYFLTGNVKYLQGLGAFLKSWTEENPVLIGVNWVSAMELAIRANSWIWCYCLLGTHNKREEHEIRSLLLNGIIQHCMFIEKNLSLYSSANNHLIVEVSVLGIAGILFEKLPYASRWVKLCTDMLERQLPKQVHKDGVSAEQAFHYHAFAMEALFLLLVIAGNNGIKLPSVISESLEKMCGFIWSVMDRCGNVPDIGDSDDGHIVKLSCEHFNYYRFLLLLGTVIFKRGDFKNKAGPYNEQAFWILGQDGMEKFYAINCGSSAESSKLFEDGGYAVIKYSDSEKERQMLFDFGPLGLGALAAHGHADALGITLSINGNAVFIDPGTYIYNVRREWRDYFRSTCVHNTICINGRNQSVISGPFIWSRKAKAKLVSAVKNKRYEFYSAEHDGYKPLIHRRGILYIKPDLWIIQDKISGGGPYSFELTYNIADNIKIGKIEKNRANLEMRDGSRIYCEYYCSEDFELSLEDSWVSGKFGVKEKGRVVKIRGKGVRATVVYSLISLDEKHQADMNDMDLEVSSGILKFKLAAEGVINIL